MTAPIPGLDGPLWPYLAVALFAALPTEVWRWLAVLFARRIEPDSAALEWVRAVASALLAGVVAKLLIAAPGALAAVPFALRVAAVATGVAVVLATRRVMLALFCGEVLLVGGMLLLG